MLVNSTPSLHSKPQDNKSHYGVMFLKGLGLLKVSQTALILLNNVIALMDIKQNFPKYSKIYQGGVYSTGFTWVWCSNTSVKFFRALVFSTFP